MSTTLEDQNKNISMEIFKTAVEEGNVVMITKIFSSVDKHMLSDIESKSFQCVSEGIFARASRMPYSQTLLLLCAFYTSHKIYIDFKNALKNAILANQKKNVLILRQFGACYNNIKFIDKTDERSCASKLKKMGLYLDEDCNDENCYACDDTREYENFKIDMECRYH